MPASLHDVLAEIGHPASEAPRLPAPGAAGRGEAAPPMASEVAPAFGPRPPRPEEIEARVAEAYARGAAEAREAADAAHAEALAEVRARATAAHEAALAEARAAWAVETADQLAALVVEGIGAIEERVSEAAARALAPLLRSAARDRALEGLAEAVATLLRAEPALTLAVRGPADLGEALLARLGEAGNAVEFTPADTPDLRVEGGDTLIETRLADWARRMQADIA